MSELKELFEKEVKHISWAEATRTSVVSLNNEPKREQTVLNMVKVAKVFDRLRDHFGVPIRVNSFYRSPSVNRAIGGSQSSAHINGLAIDISVPARSTITNKQLFDWLRANTDFDQLIWEFGTSTNPSWVHFGIRENPVQNRKEALRFAKVKGKTVITRL